MNANRCTFKKLKLWAQGDKCYFDETSTEENLRLELKDEYIDNEIILMDILKSAKDTFRAKGLEMELQFDPFFEVYVFNPGTYDEADDEDGSYDEDYDIDYEEWVLVPLGEWKILKKTSHESIFVDITCPDDDLWVELEICDGEYYVRRLAVSFETWDALIDVLEDYELISKKQVKELRL